MSDLREHIPGWRNRVTEALTVWNKTSHPFGGWKVFSGGGYVSIGSKHPEEIAGKMPGSTNDDDSNPNNYRFMAEAHEQVPNLCRGLDMFMDAYEHMCIMYEGAATLVKSLEKRVAELEARIPKEED